MRTGLLHLHFDSFWFSTVLSFLHMAQDNFMHSHPAEHHSTVLTCTAEVLPNTFSRSRPEQCTGSDECLRRCIDASMRRCWGFVENVEHSEKTQHVYGSCICVWRQMLTLNCRKLRIQSQCVIYRVYMKNFGVIRNMKYHLRLDQSEGNIRNNRSAF